jgi:transcriptional regulator with XRE-family HTH domain
MNVTNPWLLSKRDSSPDLEILEEAALAMAQATIQNAITRSGLSRAELARRLDRPRSFISRILSGDHNLTIKTMARTLLACGYEVRFGSEPLNWGWLHVEQHTPVVIEGDQSTCADIEKADEPRMAA